MLPARVLTALFVGMALMPAYVSAQESGKSITQAAARKAASKPSATAPRAAGSTSSRTTGTSGDAGGTNNDANGALNGSGKALQQAKRVIEDPLTGVVVNRTVTVQGHDFYRYFSAWWRDMDAEGSYSISIHERPSARWGSEVWVQFRRERVFHMFLPPARSRTKEISRQAVEIAWDNITRNELQRAIYQSEDLGPEEM